MGEKKISFIQWCKGLWTFIPCSLLITNTETIPEDRQLYLLLLWKHQHREMKQASCWSWTEHSPYSEACLGTFWYYNKQPLRKRYKMFLQRGLVQPAGSAGTFLKDGKCSFEFPPDKRRDWTSVHHITDDCTEHWAYRWGGGKTLPLVALYNHDPLLYLE